MIEGTLLLLTIVASTYALGVALAAVLSQPPLPPVDDGDI